MSLKGVFVGALKKTPLIFGFGASPIFYIDYNPWVQTMKDFFGLGDRNQYSDTYNLLLKISYKRFHFFNFLSLRKETPKSFKWICFVLFETNFRWIRLNRILCRSKPSCVPTAIKAVNALIRYEYIFMIEKWNKSIY